ncbi:hypothetical protein VC83_00470 [Pseudogymnoascus destructans]|uniref:FAD-binding PCMH-type domain-containing protein n=2 Tax=Pseudogymnoascus destructans TaxID=655981 RepID=L8GBC3_PSED2|nr:uncharacterized protein VC83_00470 [Pseudogymnoascus destructans]ELR10382.1 hypothetical protein GMDG_00795 [Pseudogymnoascus destructans 20631-21]OAF63099.1 hypothetical protein VC83_00470 [Pseudogymnoascus destructans]
MSTNSAKKASGSGNRGPKWGDVKKWERGVSATSGMPESRSLPTSQNVAIDTTNSPGFEHPGVASSCMSPQEKSIVTLSAEDRAVAEAIDAIEELTSDFDATSIEAGPSKRTPEATIQQKTQTPKLETTAGPSRKKESRTWSVNDSPNNNYQGPFPTDDAYENSPASSLWDDDQSWHIPSYLRFNPARLLIYRMKPRQKTMRQRLSSMKQKAVEIATNVDWVKEAMASIRNKAGAESPKHKEKSAENSRACSKDISDLSLRGGAGNMSSLNGGGNDILGFGGGSDTCCAQLSASLGSSVVFNSSSEYGKSQSSHWALQQSELIPSCIIVPSRASEVSDAISIISTIETCNFAIKGAGHGTVVGAANIDGGVKFDMSQLNEIETNSEGTVTRIGAGSQWGEVYEYLENRGLSVAGGRNGDVGVAGVLLGGGISFYGPRVGWATDNILNAEVVLASGEIVNANATSNQDLLKALKGGNSNFGIATSFDLRTFPQGAMWVGYLGQSINSREEVFQAISDIASNANEDPFAALVGDFKFNSATKSWVMNHTVAYTKPVANPPIFQPLVNINPQLSNNIAITNISSIALGQKMGAKAAYNKNHLSYTGTYGNDAALLSKIFDISNATVHKIMPQINGGIKWVTMMEPFPALVDSFGGKNGGNSLGLSAETGDRIVILQLAQFDDREANDLVDTELHNMFDEIASVASEMGLLRRFRYLNYADKQQNPISSYGPENVAQLQATSKKYDPNGLFQRQAPGGFKLGM